MWNLCFCQEIWSIGLLAIFTVLCVICIRWWVNRLYGPCGRLCWHRNYTWQLLICFILKCVVFWIMCLNMSSRICVYHTTTHTPDNDISLSARDIYESWPFYCTRTAWIYFCQHKLNSTPALAASLPFLLTEANMLSTSPPPLGKRASSSSLFSSLLVLFHSQYSLSIYQKKMWVVLARGCHRALLFSLVSSTLLWMFRVVARALLDGF